MLTRRVIHPSVRRVAVRALSSSAHFILNAIGEDRPGIVSEVTKFVTDAGGNVGVSQSARLGPHFGIMMQVSMPSADAAKELQTSVTTIQGLDTSCFEIGDPKATSVTPTIAFTGKFELSGADNPGIVHKVTSLLAKHSLSIDRMETNDEEAPYGGTRLFFAEGMVNAMEPLPKSFDINGIRDELEALGDSLNCDITFEEVLENENASRSSV